MRSLLRRDRCALAATMLVAAAIVCPADSARAQPQAAPTQARPQVVPLEVLKPVERKLEDAPRLAIRGSAELVRPADELRISIGVTSEAARAQDALENNNRRMAKVLDALEKAGLAEDEYQTGHFRIRPSYAPRPRQPEPDWRPKIVGYEVVNSLSIRTRQLDQAGTFIQVANDAGADTIDGIAFGLSDDRAYREQAVREAIGNAMQDAAWTVDAAGLRLVRIINLTLDHDRPQFGVMDGAVRAMAAGDLAGAAPIAPGDVTVRAGVTIVWEIAPRRD